MSNSVPTAVMVPQQVGDDTRKHIKGRKPFPLVDTLGLLLAVQHELWTHCPSAPATNSIAQRIIAQLTMSLASHLNGAEATTN